MRLQEQIQETTRQAQASGGPSFLGANPPMGPGADNRWRPTPDPVDGALHFDPEFSLPSVAGPVTWRLFYNTVRSDRGLEYGWGRFGSFPLVLTHDPIGDNVTVMHEDGTIRTYNPSGGGYAAHPLNGDALVKNGDGSWDETLADSGFQYHFPAGDLSRLDHRTTPQGQRLTYTYNTDPSSGQYLSISVQEPAGRRVTLTCNGQGLVQTVEDWGGRGLVVLTYNGNNELTELWEQEGVVTRYGYDTGGLHIVTSIVDPLGYETTYTYGIDLYTCLSRSVAGQYSQYDHSVLGQCGYIDPLGRIWTYLNNSGYPHVRIDPLGNRQTYTYDSTSLLPMQFQDELGNATTFSYDANGYLQSVQDKLGHFTTFMHDGNGNILSIINALGNITTFTYGADATKRQLTEVIDPLGNRTTFGYDTNGLPQYIVDAAGYRTTYVWNNLGVLASALNARGNIWTYTYDAVGNRIETLDPLGYRWTYGYDQRGRLVSEQTPLGARWTTVYDARDLVQAVVDPLGFRTTYTRNAEGRVTEEVDATGNRWTNVYDTADQQKAAIDPLGQRTSFYYDLAARLTVVQDALGALSTLIYDAAGRQIAAVDPLGNCTTSGYDAAGRVISILNARGYVTTYSYDAVGYIRTVLNALGYMITVNYDANGRPTVIYDPLGNRTTVQYDARGLAQVQIDPLGNRTTCAYTPTGRLQSVTDPRGHLWTSVYDAWDRLQATVDPLGNPATVIYDPSGRVSALWDARGFRWTTTYDARDLAIGTTDPLGRKATYAYNATGQLVTYTDQKGQLATLSFNSRYDLTGEQYADGTRTTSSYDAVGQLRTVVDATGWHTMSYSARGDITSVQAPQHPSGGILTYVYDAVGNRTGLFSWLGPQTMTYDALDRCTSLLFDNASKLTTWLYDGLNRPTMQFHWNNARTTWAYDPRGLLSLVRHATNVPALLDSATYTYDAAGNPLTRATNSTRATWTYDNAGQLLTERHSTNGLIDTYTYDAARNRTQRARTQSGELTLSTYVYDAAGQLVTMLAGTALTTFVYDSNGNLQSENTSPSGSTTYTWDALDRMTGVIVPGGTRTTYVYRYDDLRASQNTGSGVQTLVWDMPGLSGYGDLFEELDSTGNLLRAYYRAVDLAAQKDASGSYAFHWIDQGTAEVLTDLNQVVTQSYQFSAWGELLQSQGALTVPLSWNGDWGYYRDTSARTWVRGRHLDIVRGRWFSPDPIGLAGGLNLYVYVDNLAGLNVDPTGWARPTVYEPAFEDRPVRDQKTGKPLKDENGQPITVRVRIGDWVTRKGSEKPELLRYPEAPDKHRGHVKGRNVGISGVPGQGEDSKTPKGNRSPRSTGGSGVRRILQCPPLTPAAHHYPKMPPVAPPHSTLLLPSGSRQRLPAGVPAHGGSARPSHLKIDWGEVAGVGLGLAALAGLFVISKGRGGPILLQPKPAAAGTGIIWVPAGTKGEGQQVD